MGVCASADSPYAVLQLHLYTIYLIFGRIEKLWVRITVLGYPQIAFMPPQMMMLNAKWDDNNWFMYGFDLLSLCTKYVFVSNTVKTRTKWLRNAKFNWRYWWIAPRASLVYFCGSFDIDNDVLFSFICFHVFSVIDNGQIIKYLQSTDWSFVHIIRVVIFHGNSLCLVVPIIIMQIKRDPMMRTWNHVNCSLSKHETSK